MAMYEKEVKNASVNNYRFAFIEKSGNAKTGIISQTYTAVLHNMCGSCPHRCPFANAGCYAKCGHVVMHWRRIAEKGLTLEELGNAIESSKKKTSVLRHNIAGDMCKENSNDLNPDLVDKLSDIYSKNFSVAYTYTHSDINNQDNIEIVKNAAKKNFVINFSVENIESAKKALQAGCNVAMAVNTMSKNVVKKEGITFTRCPQSLNPDFKCENCGMCWKKNRKNVVVFPVHSAAKNKAIKAGFLTDL